MLSITKKEELRGKVCRMLSNVGMKVDCEEMKKILLGKGCSEVTNNRIRIPEELIKEFSTSQEKKLDKEDEKEFLEMTLEFGAAYTKFLLWSGRKDVVKKKLESELITNIFDDGPTKFYDYTERKEIPVNTEILTNMMKLAHAIPEVGYVPAWYRQDVPQKTERISSLIEALKLTDKVGGVESISIGQVKYLIEIGDIMGENPKGCPYLHGSQCMTSPLMLEARSAEEMIERKKRGVGRYYVASMITLGVSTPVSLSDSIILGAAEILGGMIAAYCLDPEAEITGRMITSVLDMKTANATMCRPEGAIVNAGVRELFDDFFGSQIRTTPDYMTTAKVPGLQAVYENFFSGSAFSKVMNLNETFYPGVGVLNIAGAGSPTQAIMDIEIKKSQYFLRKQCEMNDSSMDFKEFCEGISNGKEFLNSDYTLNHFRDIWSPSIFISGNAESADEKSILDRCDEIWRENIKNYKPRELPEEKRKALDGLLARANKELL